MKITEMIHATVVAFEPKKHRFYALLALAMMLFAIVALVYLGGSGAGAVAKQVTATVRLRQLL